MAKNRTTTHRGKVGNARHNEHRFYEKDDRSTCLISFIHKKGDTTWDLTAEELKFYENYLGQLNEQNEKYIKERQYKRVKTIEDFYNSKRYRPTEEIIQYGCVDSEVPDKKTFNEMVKAYTKRKMEWSKAHGNHLHLLNVSNHFDESTPHGHLREIWDYTDENGIKRVAQEEAMKRAGIALPEPDKPEGRYNNRAMTYTAMCREWWQDVCEEFKFDVERVPLENGRKKSETIPQYHARKGRELKEREDELCDAESNFEVVCSQITGKDYSEGDHAMSELFDDLVQWSQDMKDIAEQNEKYAEELERLHGVHVQAEQKKRNRQIIERTKQMGERFSNIAEEYREMGD